MNVISEKEAFDMISTLKTSFRSVRRTTNNLKNDDSLSYPEKYEQIEIIEQSCVENTLNMSNMNKEFIVGIHELLISYQSASIGSSEAYREFLSKYVRGNIEKLVHFMNTVLYPEYDYAIKHPKTIINIYMNKIEE